MTAVRRDGADLLLAIRARPGARHDAILAVTGDAVKVAIATAPERGRATADLLRFLGREFGVPARDVHLIAGEFAPMKRVRIVRPQRIPPVLQPVLDHQGRTSL
jgi:uncharacterized protein (TIGR00251 family)